MLTQQSYWNSISEEMVRTMAESTDALIFLDEAYAEFAEKSLFKMVGDHENLIIGRTHLQGLRTGRVDAGTCRRS